MKTAVILVDYNGAADTAQCLDSIRAQEGMELYTVVVDNSGSNDGFSRIAERYPETTLLWQNRNLGFSGGNNVGISHALAAGCDTLFLVNNDTVLEPDCLAQLLHGSRCHPEAALIAPAIYHESERDRPWFTGSTLDWPTFAAQHETRDVRALRITEPFPIPWATGCAMLIPARAMRALGGFDERFFCYYEDIDLSFRAAQQGYSCILCPASVLYHKVGATVNRRRRLQSYYDTRNRFLLFSLHTSGAARASALKFLRRSSLKAVRRAALKGRNPHERSRALAILLGALDFHRQRFGECPYSFL